jgi:hypothetical protein
LRVDRIEQDAPAQTVARDRRLMLIGKQTPPEAPMTPWDPQDLLSDPDFLRDLLIKNLAPESKFSYTTRANSSARRGSGIESRMASCLMNSAERRGTVP